MIHHIYASGQEAVDVSVRLVNLSEKSDCISSTKSMKNNSLGS